MSETILEVKDVKVAFRTREGKMARANDDVNVTVAKGEVVALVGESGCGKTTLARTILGLEKPMSGEIMFRGEPLKYTTRSLRTYRRQVQLVLQDPTGSLNPRKSIYELVAEGPRVHKMDDEVGRVTRALSQSGLRPPESFFLRYPHELSGGQRQRVVIAGALALEPDLLIADEPVSSLDASVRGEILALLLRLREDLGLTVVVVTHDLGLAWNIADRIVVMYLGRIVEQGTTEEVLQNPQHPYTKALLSVVPEMEQSEPIVLVGETPDPSKIPAGCRFNPRCQEVANGNAERAGVLRRCLTESPEVLAGDLQAHAAACHLVGAPVVS